jgi:hypothetical protein
MSLFGLFNRPAPIAQCPAWRLVLAAEVGGLREVGLSADEQRLLVVSYAGRGLFDLESARRLARDDEVPGPDCAWLDTAARRVRGIGVSEREWFNAVGVWGGALASGSGDAATATRGWMVEVRGTGRSERALVGPVDDKPRWLVGQPLGEIRAFGFSPSGCLLLLGSSSELSVYARTEARSQAPGPG